MGINFEGKGHYVRQRDIIATLPIYGPVIYTTPFEMVFMREGPLRGQVRGNRALEIETFLGPVKWHRAVRRVPFRAQKSRITKIIRNQQETVTYTKERSGT
jgi:hypothetical protein